MRPSPPAPPRGRLAAVVARWTPPRCPGVAALPTQRASGPAFGPGRNRAPSGRASVPTTCASAATFSRPGGTGTASFRPPAHPQPASSSSSPLRAALAAAGPAGLVAMALSNALFYTCAFTIAARSLPRPPPGGGWAPALAAVGKAWGIAYGSGLATKAPRSAAILALMPFVGRALSVVSGGDPRRAVRMGTAIALTCLASVFAVLGVAAVAWA